MRLRAESLVWREIDGEAVLLDLAASTYLTVNRTGTLLVRLLVEERRREDLVDALVGAYDLTEEAASTDVDAFLEQLAERSLVVP